MILSKKNKRSCNLFRRSSVFRKTIRDHCLVD